MNSKIRLNEDKEIVKKHTEETKERIRQKKLGFRHTEETKKKIGEASAKFMTGRKLPKEVCENIRKSKSREKNPNFGKKWMFNEQTNHRLCVKIEEIEEKAHGSCSIIDIYKCKNYLGQEFFL